MKDPDYDRGGVKGFDFETWYGLFRPGNLPGNLVSVERLGQQDRRDAGGQEQFSWQGIGRKAATATSTSSFVLKS
jgi:hypothetical protein